MTSLKAAKRIAGTSFVIGTLLFLFQLLLGYQLSLGIIGLAYIALALFVNGIAFLLAFIKLIKTDELDAFFAMCILLANLPIAIGYIYIIEQIR